MCESTVVASNDAHDRSLIANTGFSRPTVTPHRRAKAFTDYHEQGVAWPTSVTQKGFSQLHSHHGFNTLTPPKVPIPHQWTFPEHDMSLRVLLEKRDQHLRREQLDPNLSILVKVSVQALN